MFTLRFEVKGRQMRSGQGMSKFSVGKCFMSDDFSSEPQSSTMLRMHDPRIETRASMIVPE